jgi:hypothetical protein
VKAIRKCGVAKAANHAEVRTSTTISILMRRHSSAASLVQEHTLSSITRVDHSDCSHVEDRPSKGPDSISIDLNFASIAAGRNIETNQRPGMLPGLHGTQRWLVM